MNNTSEEIRLIQIPDSEQLSDSTDSIILMSIFLTVLKRPWILGLSLLIVLAPLLHHIIKQPTLYKSSFTTMVSVWETHFFDVSSLVDGRRANYKSQKYYTSILDSKAYRSDILEQVINTHPNMPRDSLWSVVRGGIRYTTKDREPGFIVISATSQSKEFALTLAETALSEFRKRLVNLEREDALHISEFIRNQIESITNKLERAEEALQFFLSSKKLIMVDIEQGITQELLLLEQKHNEAKANLEMININIDAYQHQMSGLIDLLAYDVGTDDDVGMIELKNRLTEIRSVLNDVESLNLNQTDVKTLEMERDEKRNRLISLLSPATSGMGNSDPFTNITIQRVEEELETALVKQSDYRNQIRFYRLQIERFKDEHPDLSADILKFASLSRAGTVLEKTLDILLEKQEEIRLRVESEMGGVKVIDAPRLPDGPVSTRKNQKLLFGSLAALLLGIGLCVAIDHFDNTIKDQNDIQKNFGLSVFGSIPSLDADRYSKKHVKYHDIDSTPGGVKGQEFERKLLIRSSEKSPIAEAYRSNKIALQFLASDKSKKMFVISSPSISEGKSLTTANLSISFAQGDRQTLLIDCDLRKAVQHKFFDIDRKPGLVDYLYGDVELEDIILDSGVPNLSIIPTGSSSSNPAELLASRKMRELLEKLRSGYDFILMDTPPILVCSDSRVLAEATDGMIMIAKVESTNIKALDHAISLTKHLDIEILGVILNQVKFRYGRAYYYAYRYYKPYSYYSGYYYKRQYYDYKETETGERVRIPGTGKKV